MTYLELKNKFNVASKEYINNFNKLSEEFNNLIDDLSKQLPKQYNKKIIIDPGHGKTKINNEYKYQRKSFDSIIEDKITVKVAKHLDQFLKLHGIQTKTTRDIEEEEHLYCTYEYLRVLPSQPYGYTVIPYHFIPYGKSEESDLDRDINSRPLYANRVLADYDLLISIHFNASPIPNTGKGCEVWYYEPNNKGKLIANNILLDTIKQINDWRPGLENRGVKPGRHHSILKKPLMTSIIWEGCFFDHDEDRNKYLKDEKYYELAAKAICDGIIKSIEEELL